MEKLKRIKEAIAYLKGIQIISFQKDIVKKMGVNKSSVSQALNGHEKYLTDSFIEKFASVFELNEEWLLTGEGKMLKDADISIVREAEVRYEFDCMKENEFLKDQIKRKDMEIDRLWGMINPDDNNEKKSS